MMDGQVCRLCVVVSPGGEHVVALALAGAPVHLDLDTTHLKGQDVIINYHSLSLHDMVMV